MDKDTKKLVKWAQECGWTAKPIKAGTMYLSPDGVHKVTVHNTPSDHRTLRNLIRDFRDGGLEWPPPRKRG